MPGLQTLLPVMLKLVGEGLIGLTDLVRMCAFTPSQTLRPWPLESRIAAGYDADIVIVDRNRASTITSAEQASRAAYTPFDGWSIPARLTDVFLRGERIVSEGSLVTYTHGQVVTRQD